MEPVALFLVGIAGIFLLGAMGEVVFRRTNVPDVIWLIGAGIVLGPLSGLVPRDALIAVAPYFAALTLVVVLFEGGSRLNLSELSSAAPRSGILALLTFLCAVAVIAPLSMGAAAIGWLPDVWTWQHGLLLGSILGGSSSIIIMPAMAQARVEPKVANLVNLESAFTDAFCVVGASAMIALMIGAGGDVSPGLALGKSFGIGLAVGAAAGFLWIFVLQPLSRSEHAYPITLAALLLLYVVIDALGGSAALGILAFAILVGNASGIGRKVGLQTEVDLHPDVRGFHRQMTFFIKSFFFTFIGAMMSPPWAMIAFGILLGFMMLVARFPGVWLATIRSRLSGPQKALVLVSLPRGMAAGVLATMPMAAGIVGTDQLPTIVFAAVFTSILIFAVGFPLTRRNLTPVVAPEVPLASVEAELGVSEATNQMSVEDDGVPRI